MSDDYFDHLRVVDEHSRRHRYESEERSRHRGLSFYLRRAVLLAILLVVGYELLTGPDYYLEAPGPSYCERDVIAVEGKAIHGKGCFYALTVQLKPANWAERIFPRFRNSDTLVPGEKIRRYQFTYGNTNVPFWSASLEYSEKVAEAVALRNAKYRVLVEPLGVRVGAINSPAARTLDAFVDTIVAVNGHPTLTMERLQAVIRRQRPGAALRLTVLRNDARTRITVRTNATRSSPAAAIGAYLEQALNVTSPIGIDFNYPYEGGGPSAGLAFALALADRLGPKIDRGYQIAATGQLELDGRVEPIGGVKQKVRAAQRAGAEIFLVPAGENAAEAQRNAGKMKIIPVTSFQQALRKLAKLPPR